MSIKDWWDAVKDPFEKKPPKPPFIPPHTWPKDKPLPPWPDKKNEPK